MLTSERLQAIADFIDESDYVADIGADHGKLIIEIANKFPKNRYLAVENKQGPFDNLQNSVKNYNFNKNIECSLSDGIDYLPDYVNTLVFSGMGGFNVIEIILRNEEKLKNIKKIVFSVHRNFYDLEFFLKYRGYFHANHKFVTESGQNYLIFDVRFNEKNVFAPFLNPKKNGNEQNTLKNEEKIISNPKNKEEIKKLLLNKLHKYTKSYFETGISYED